MMSDEGEIRDPLWKRLGWLILIWCLSVATLGAVATAIRWLMSLVGLSL